MAKQKYALDPGEKIVYKVSCVRHGFWGAYTNILTITNQSVILEKYGMLNNFKGIERFDYSAISQAIQGEASNGEKQLELYIDDKIENFALQSDDENEMKILVMAINDQMGSDAEHYDYNYYQTIVTEAKDADRILELRAKALEEDTISDFGIAGSAMKLMGKQKKQGIFSSVMDELLDDVGVRDIQDEFTEIANELRGEFGLKPKMTHAERKELKKLEEKQRRQEIQRQKDAAFQSRVAQQQTRISAQKDRTMEAADQSTVTAKMSVKEQMELLQQIKDLLDAGVLTQEEFERKKQEILNG